MASNEKNVLVVNCGSSSVKFAIVNPVDGKVSVSGIAEALNLEDARISWAFDGENKTEQSLGAGADHAKAIDFVVDTILAGHKELLDSLVAVGHRIVSGGDLYSQPTLVDDSVEAGIEKCIPFAPLHNPAHLQGIRAGRKVFPGIPHVCVFDTAFHQTMPEYAFRFAIPEKYYTENRIRRYGAHGTSHYYVAGEACRELGGDPDNFNVITCHLGNGASISAVKNGKCIDTSMGLTPLDGLMMGTRSGSIDPSVIFFLCDNLGLTAQEVCKILNKESGLLGISGKTSDFRGITEGKLAGDEKCTLAFNMFCYRLAKFIGSYFVPLGRVDAIVFTGGIGENSFRMREKVLELLEEPFGIKIDRDKNEQALVYKGGRGLISTPDSSCKVTVIPTNEELIIARLAGEFAK